MLKKLLDPQKITKTPSLVSKDLYVKGKASSEGEVCVDGTFEGELHVTSLIVGLNGTVKGTITASVVKSYGKIDGSLFADTIFLGSTSKTYGEINHAALTVETGALIEATIAQKTERTAKK